MNDNVMLSVLVITYNQENFISQTLDSILNQKHGYKYEIVVGEDCSTDGTKRIVEEYAAKYPDVIKPLYNNPNKGLIRNYFETLALCKGKYIMDCAGDDWWLSGKISKQIEFMETHSDVGMCYGKARQFLQEKNKIVWKRLGLKRETFDELIEGNGIPALTTCMRKTEFDRYVAEENPIEKSWLMEDYPMWLWFSVQSKICFLNDTFAVYRVLTNSLSHFEKIDDSAMKFIKSECEIKSYFLHKYRGTACIEFDMHREHVWLMAKNSFYSRKQVLEEFGKIKQPTARDRKLLFVCKNPFLFFLLRLRWKVMGVGR